MTLYPESRVVVTLTGTEIISQYPDGTLQSVSLSELRRVLVETNDSGPWGIDVWWILEGASPDQQCCFPQGATGEEEVLRYLATLPGFEVRGMNSMDNEQFECWPHPDPDGRPLATSD